jgi:hypothetical protein
MDVLQQRISQHLGVLRTPDDGRDGGQSGALRGLPAPLAHDQLVTPRFQFPDDDRLEQAELADGMGELGQRVLVEHGPRVAGVALDPLDPDLRVSRSARSSSHGRRRG